VPPVLAGLGTSILTTSRGVMTGRAASRPASAAKCSATLVVRLQPGSRSRSWKLKETREKRHVSNRKETDRDPEGRHRQGARRRVEVQGPKGKLRQALPPGINFELAGTAGREALREDPSSASSTAWRAAWSPTPCRRHRRLQEGARHRRRRLPRRAEGQAGHFALGYSHPVVFDIPTGIDIAIDKQTHITVTGVDRQLVGQVAANIRRLRKPDPYKQKGVRYTGEVLKKKAGKTGRSKERNNARSRYEDQDEKIAATGSSCGSASGFRHDRGAAAARVFRSVSHIYAQVIDDMSGQTLASASSVEPREGRVRQGARAAATSPAPKAIGKTIAERLIEKGIKRVVFDRGGFLYHGRIRAVADAAREAGLEF
jgi:ribosomal protein L18